MPSRRSHSSGSPYCFQYSESFRRVRNPCNRISDEKDSILRFQLAEFRHNDADTVYSLTHPAQAWPSALPGIPFRSVQAAVGAALKVPEKEFELLQALFAARYTSEWGHRDERSVALAPLRRPTRLADSPSTSG